MASFAELRKRTDPLAEMQAKLKQAEKSSNRNELEDETFWSMNHLRGDEGTGYAVIRFLPAPPDGNGGQEDDAWVTFHEHIFQGEQHWYVNRSRMTLGSNERDPVYEYNGKIFKDKSLSDEEKKKRLLPRKINFIANILVVEDPIKPENNGKVFRFKYGPQIQQIIQSAAFPEFGGSPIPVFDPLEGANFQIRVYTKKIGKDFVPSYEKSGFLDVSPIVKNIDDFDAIWERQHSLRELVAPSKFRPYKELKARFDLVMGNISQEEYDSIMSDEPDAMKSEKKAEAPKKTLAQDAGSIPSSFTKDIDDDIPFASSKSAKDEDPVDDAGSDAGDSSSDDDDWFQQLKRS